jgi:hypothetical protein
MTTTTTGAAGTEAGIDLGKLMSKAEIDEIVYACRQAGKDTTYDIVNAALARRAPAPADERALFEATVDQRHPRDRNMPDGSYNSPYLHIAWEVWQLARAAHQAAPAQPLGVKIAATNEAAQPCGGREYCGRMPFCGCGDEPLFPERDTSKPAEQQGIFRKFDVRRVDGSDKSGGKHYGCRYYVLDLTHDQHAPAAMRAYAAACRATHPQLAADIEAEFGAAPAQPRTPVSSSGGASGEWFTISMSRPLTFTLGYTHTVTPVQASVDQAAPAQQRDTHGPLLVARIKRYKEAFCCSLLEAKNACEFYRDLNSERNEFVSPESAPAHPSAAPIYQARAENSWTWADVDREVYELMGPKLRRIVYAAPTSDQQAGAVAVQVGYMRLLDSGTKMGIGFDKLEEPLIEGWRQVPVFAYLAAPAAIEQAGAPIDEQEGVAGLRPYEFSVCGKSLRWYLKRDVDALFVEQAGAQPVDPIYQVKRTKHGGGWIDTYKSSYDSTADWNRRIVYLAAPTPATNQTEEAPSVKQEKLRALADRIDHEKSWKLPFMDHHKLTADQKDRLDCGIMLRRYADLLAPGRWLVLPPTGNVQFSASTLEKVAEMAKRAQDRRAATPVTDQPKQGDQQ